MFFPSANVHRRVTKIDREDERVVVDRRCLVASLSNFYNAQNIENTHRDSSLRLIITIEICIQSEMKRASLSFHRTTIIEACGTRSLHSPSILTRRSVETRTSKYADNLFIHIEMKCHRYRKSMFCENFLNRSSCR